MVADADKHTGGYICIPHAQESNGLIDRLKKSDQILDIYFVTATFSQDSLPYFPNRANHYLLANFGDSYSILEYIKNHGIDGLSFKFGLEGALFERAGEKLSYVSIYFTKYTYGEVDIGYLANILAKRDRVNKASLASMEVVTSQQVKFRFPYSKNVIVLEVEGEKTYQSDQKYCEQTRRDVVRKGILLSNLLSFCILEKLR